MVTTFCRTRYTYNSYTDFFKLAELCGYPVIYVDEIPKDAPGETFIISPVNGEWKQGIETSGKVVWWNLEWGLGDGAPPGVDETWTSDRYHASEIGARFVPLGSHPGLLGNLQPAKRWTNALWDVCLLAYMGPHRRQHVVPSLTTRGLRVAERGWGEERFRILEQSRCMLNVHQLDEWPCVPVQRFALAAAAAIPLVSEAIVDPYPYEPGVDFVSAAYEDVIQATVTLLGNSMGRNLAGSLHAKACGDFRFDKNVERALEGVKA